LDVIFTEEAEVQLDEIYRYIADHSYEDRAASYVERIIQCCRGLSTFPERGTRWDDIRPGLRLIGFERRVTIAFAVGQNQVTILGVFYGGQDIRAALSTEND